MFCLHLLEYAKKCNVCGVRCVKNFCLINFQIVAGVKYILLVEIAPTTCPEHTTQNCPTEVCEIEFFQQPWLSKTKSIISNNCTVSQEFHPRTERENEIDGVIKKKKFVDERFSDADSESDTNWLAELESQIVGNEEESVPSVRPLERKVIEQHNGYDGGFFGNGNLETTTNVEPTTESSTVLPHIGEQENEEANVSQESNSSEENKENENKKQSSEEKKSNEDLEKRFIRAADSSSSESSKSSSHSSENQQKKSKSNSSQSSSKSSESSEEQKNRKEKRSTTPLEKISPDEKPLVRHLADFAASTLDNIDDDNHKRIVLQILGAKKMKMQGTLYHLTMRIGVSQCIEDEYDENCKDKLFENLTKICKVQVHVSEDQFSHRVLKSQCQTIKKDNSDINRTTHNRFRRALLGGKQKISTDDPVRNIFLSNVFPFFITIINKVHDT